MQALTGHCAHSFQCEKWQTGCGDCPDLAIYPELAVDTTAQLYRHKKLIYDHSALHIVTPSNWLREKVSKSILQNHPVDLIYNGVDTAIFKPHDKAICRNRFSVPHDKLVIGAIAHGGALANLWKGGSYTQSVLNALQNHLPEFVFVNIGDNTPSPHPQIINIPHVSDESELARAYSTLDIFLYTPAADNCPLVVLEALACGLPVATFRTGGIPELVRDGVDGFVTPYKDPQALTEALTKLAVEPELRKEFARNARSRAVETFDHENIASQYLDVYQRCIEQHSRRIADLRPLPMESVPEIIVNDAFLNANSSQKPRPRPSESPQTKETHITKPTIVSKKTTLPRISIVTPSFNQAEYLEECIDSVLGQNYPNLEYIIMDGASTDASVDIIKKHEKYLTYWQSQTDGGQYAAIQVGFEKSSGQIMAWLNSDDKYHPDALAKAAYIFSERSDIQWLTGRHSAWNAAGKLINVGWIPQWSRSFYLDPNLKLYIQQEGTFWTRRLWDKAGARMDTSLQYAGDAELWIRFFRFAELHSLDTWLAGFRHHQGQKTKTGMQEYCREFRMLVEREMKEQTQPNTCTSPPPDTVMLNKSRFRKFKQSHGVGSSVDPDDRITVATSIAPFRIEEQQKAVQSWLSLGFQVISINCTEEIEQLQEFFPSVRFVPAPRDARRLYSKPLIYLDDVLAALAQTESPVCGIVNSDIRLDADARISDYIRTQTRNAMLYGSRLDVEKPDHVEGRVYDCGFDFFFFDRAVIDRIPKSQFCLGMPWWDYWLPLMAVLTGAEIRELITPFALHCRHEFEWAGDDWGRLAAQFVEHLRPGIDANFEEDPEKNPWAYIGQALCSHHHRYLRDNDLDDSTQMSVWILVPCILKVLKNLATQVSYSVNQPETPATDSGPAAISEEPRCDVSIVLATKDRAELLDQTLTSLEAAASDIDYEVIVIEGESSDNTLDVLCSHNITQIYSETENLGPGRHSWPRLYNFGFSKASGRYAMYASDDILFSPGCITKAVRTLDSQPKETAGGIFFYRNKYASHSDWARYGIDYTYGQKLLMNYGLFRLEAFCAVGGLDEYYRFYCADTDFCLKLYENDHSLIPLPDCLITHNNILDNRKQENLAESDRDIRLLLKKWSHFVSPALPDPRRLMHESCAGISRTSVEYETSVLIFSKDRPMQLRAAIESFHLHCADSDSAKIVVLYKASNAKFERQYDQLEETFPQVEFMPETNFRSQTLAVLEHCENILFLVDDNLFTVSFSVQKTVVAISDHLDALGFSLRLGRNTTYCYAHDSNQALPAFDRVADSILKFDWTAAEHDFGYPLELSSSVYRTADLLPLITELQFENPNTLEAALAANASHFARAKPNLLCFENSVAFCNPVNIVQSQWQNRSGGDPRYGPEKLAELFDLGRKIDVDQFSRLKTDSCHQEVPLNFVDADAAPKFTVVMANYNNAAYIDDAIQSVLNQSLTDWRLIVVDDASTDDSLRKIEKHLSDSRITLIRHDTNRGYTAALKTGISHVESEIFGILDSDDYLEPDALETMHAAHTENPDHGLIYSQFTYCTAGLEPIKPGFCERICESGSALDKNVVSHFKTFKLTDYRKTEGYDENILYAEDVDIIYKMEEVTHLKFVDRPLYLYRELPTSITHSKEKINIAIMSRVKARINALKRRAVARAVEQHKDVADLFRRSMEQARSQNPDVGQYFELLARIHDNGLLSDIRIPQNLGRDDELLWLAANVNIDFRKLCEKLKTEPGAEHPLVSVCMVTYNAEKYIRRAVESVLAQTFADFELMIVDDGSTDSTPEILASFADHRIRCIRRKHRNFAAGLNRAIQAANGRYLLNVDSDDFIAPEYLEKMIAAARKYPQADYLYPAGLTIIDQFDTPTGEQWSYRNFCDNSTLPSFIFRNGFGPIPNPGSLKKKSLFERLGTYEELETVEDFVFLSQNALEINFQRVDDHAQYFYRRLPSGNSSKFLARNRIMAEALDRMVAVYSPEQLCPELARIDNAEIKTRRFWRYVAMVFENHASNPITAHPEFFRKYADKYRKKVGSAPQIAEAPA